MRDTLPADDPGEAPAEPRRRGRPGYDQATVVRRAVDLFNRQGYDATSVGDLAKELGVSKSAIYHHVDSKESLLAAAVDDALDALSAAIDRATVPTGASAYEQLRRAVLESVTILVEHLPEVTLLLRVRGNSPVELAALERRRAIDDRLAGLVRRAVDEGSIRPDIAPEVVSRLLFGLVNSLVEWYRADGSVDAVVLANAVASMAFDGLSVQGPGITPAASGPWSSRSPSPVRSPATRRSSPRPPR
jgi:AcrR family transcriptional regulator